MQAAFTYDLQGRLHTATITSFTAGDESRIERTTYDYDATGIRVSALHEIDIDASGTWDTTTRSEYLVDHRNFTGYQQVIKETVYDDQGQIVKTIEYNFGHDEISQTVTEYDGGVPGTPETHIFGHDGHGSVKVLYDAAAVILQVYTYEAYGQMLAIHNAVAALATTGALTSLQYSGEQFDSRIGQQYLRARYYDPNSGRFNRLDPFAGNSQDPQSFHKYMYTHGNPVMGVDPSGEFTIGSVLSGMKIGAIVGGVIGGGSAFFSTLYQGGGLGDALWNGVIGALKGAFWGGLAGGLFPIFGAMLGAGGAGLGLSSTTVAAIEFFGASILTGSVTNALQAWWEGDDPVMAAVQGAVLGLVFAGAGKAFGQLTRGNNARVPSNSSESGLLDDIMTHARSLANSDRFLKASGLDKHPEIAQKFSEIFDDLAKYIGTKGGAVGWLNVKDQGSRLGLALPLNTGLRRMVAAVHELGHIAREARSLIARNRSLFEAERNLKHYDPKFWDLWLSEELAAWRITANYLFSGK